MYYFRKGGGDREVQRKKADEILSRAQTSSVSTTIKKRYVSDPMSGEKEPKKKRTKRSYAFSQNKGG